MRSTLRFLARRKTATAVAVLTLSLALAVNTVVFSVLKSFLFTGLSIPDVDRLQMIQSVRELAGRGDVVFYDAFPNYELIRRSATAFEAVAVLSQGVASWNDGERTRPLQFARVSASFFDAMRVGPAMGALFSAEDEGPSPTPVVVVSQALWQTALGADPAVIGRSMSINGAPHTIIGVMPAGFTHPAPTELWMPFSISEQARGSVSGARSLTVLGRLAGVASPATIEADVARFTALTREAHPIDNRDYRYRLRPYRSTLLDTAESAVVFVQAGAIALLLLAVSNLAPLLVAWGFDRQQESAVRQALGAGPAGSARMLFAQSAIVVGAAALLGIAIAVAALPWVRSLDLGPSLAWFLSRVRLDGGVLLASIAAAAAASVLAGLLPVWFTRRTNLADTLRAGSRSVTLSPAALRWQKGMVLAQSALSVIVLATAALIGVSFWNIVGVPFGFQAGRLQVARIELDATTYGTTALRADFARRLREHLAQEPAIAASGFSSTIPVGDLLWGGRFHADGVQGVSAENPVVLHFRRVSPEYLATIGIPLRRGRAFTPDDDAASPPVAIISQALADHFWPGQDPIGKRLYRSASAMPAPMAHEVVGVVGNVMDAGLTGPPGEAVYAPYAQVNVSRLTIVADPRGPARDALEGVRHALRLTDPSLAAHDVSSLARLTTQANALPRLQAVLLLALGVVAIGIVALGTYGVMSQVVATREKEFAIRLVFGARPGQLGRAMFVQTGRLTVPGIAAGVIAVVLLAGLLEQFAFGIGPRSPALLALVSLAMLVIAVSATVVPALRAMRVAPQDGLKA